MEKLTLPHEFTVLPNYPNPFNSTTHIRYQLPEPGRVKITIYNVLGQRVKTLVDKTQEAGAYTIHWNGVNENGTPVGSGVYFYRVVYSGMRHYHVKIAKLLLMK